jgi:hypothetical protein
VVKVVSANISFVTLPFIYGLGLMGDCDAFLKLAVVVYASISLFGMNKKTIKFIFVVLLRLKLVMRY